MKLTTNMTARPRILPVVNDGSSEDKGPNGITADWTWHDYFHSLRDERWTSRPEPPRFHAEQWGGLWVWDPGGRNKRPWYRNPRGFVDLDQWGSAQRELILDPGNKKLQNTADVEAFVQAAATFKAQGFWLGYYLGGPDAYLRQRYETAEQHASAMEGALMPLLLTHPDLIVMDHWVGFEQPEREGFNILRDRLRIHYGVELGVEPAQALTAIELYDATTACSETFEARTKWQSKHKDLLPRKLAADRIIYLNKRRSTTEEKQADVDRVIAAGNTPAVPMAQLDGLTLGGKDA